MTSGSGVVETQQRLLNDIVQAFLAENPPGWDLIEGASLRLSFFGTTQFFEVRPNGERLRIRCPRAARDHLDQLRELTTTPTGGAWLSLGLRIWPDGRFEADFNYDREPEWGPEVGREAWVEELRLHPRSPEAIPDWWRAKLGDQAPPAVSATQPLANGFQAVMSPTGAAPEREFWTTTPETTAIADRLAEVLTAAGYPASRSSDESDPGELPAGAEPVYQVLDVGTDGGGIAIFDTGAAFDFPPPSDPDQLRQLLNLATAHLSASQGWTLAPEQAALLR